MNRRNFLAGSFQLSLASAGASAYPLPGNLPASRKLALPSADQQAWQDLELGMFIHFAPNTWQDAESDTLATPLSAINPEKLDTDQWAQTAVALGARYIVFVAKHQGGFCMWQTSTTDYSIGHTPWRGGKGDVLAEVQASCKKFGLKLGVYVCPRDDHFGATTGGVCKTPELQTKYNAMYREQLTEVFSRYGDLVEIWFDGSTNTQVGDLLKKYQPHAVVFQGPQATIRWVGNEDGFAPYPCWNGIAGADARTGTATALNSDPDGDAWMPSEVDVSIRRPDWFWHTDNEQKVLTEEQLLSIYYRSVGRGAQLLLNIPANRDGLLSQADCAAAQRFGKEVARRFGKPVAATSGTGLALTLKLPRPLRLDTVILQEDTTLGERVRAYRLEAHANGHWKTIATGTAIGQKRIQPVAPMQTEAVRLTVTGSTEQPAIRALAVFDTGAAPPTDWDAPSEMWAADLAGDWADHSFSLDLTGKVTAAAQYRLRFIPKDGQVAGIRSLAFMLHGVAQPSLVKPVRGKTDELLLDITEIGGAMQISGHVDGAASGQILLQKL